MATKMSDIVKDVDVARVLQHSTHTPADTNMRVSYGTLITAEHCQQLYTALLFEAWEVQNAVNLGALVNRWWGVQQNLKHIAGVCQGMHASIDNKPETDGGGTSLTLSGTTWLNRNWVNQLWINKLADLNGSEAYIPCNGPFSAWDAATAVTREGLVVEFRHPQTQPEQIKLPEVSDEQQQQ